MLVRQLEEELRIRSLQNPGHEVRQQLETLYAENDHLSREVAILRETVKVRCVVYLCTRRTRSSRRRLEIGERNRCRLFFSRRNSN